jgi:hypothetical protein
MDLPFGGKAKAALHIPYLVRPARDTLDTAVSSWAQRCGAELVESTDGSGEVKEIVYVNAAQGGELGQVATVTFQLTPELDLPALPKRHLVVLTGTRDLSKLKSESRRDERPFEEFEDELKDKKPSTKPGKNDTTTPGPEHYEYFTTPLLSALLVTFLIFLPILFLGLYALSGIQVPPRLMDINKSVSVNKQRKEQ